MNTTVTISLLQMYLKMITYPHVIPNLYDFLSSVEYKKMFGRMFQPFLFI